MLQKSLKNPAKALTYLVNRVLAVCGHKDFRKFIVLSRSRTGSNLLLSYLNSHPGVFAKGEIFQQLRGRDHKKIMASVFNRQPRHIQAAGFKIFYYHPLDDKNSPVWRELLAVPELHVIHLRRRNILKTLVSRKIAEIEGSWKTASAKAAAKKPNAVFIGSEELRQGFFETREWEMKAERMFAGRPMLHLDYEYLIADPHGAFKQIADFLGLAYRPPRTRMKKQNPLAVNALLANYDELKTAFSGSEWAAFFSE